ncbi:MAG: PAS domain S-box protein [Deltaproteobacteria bacterium]|nr:PAS domain S-box protein [Deltaproteobacteria bacterium]
MTFRSRILLLAILACFLPFCTIFLTLTLASYTLQKEINRSLSNLVLPEQVLPTVNRPHSRALPAIFRVAAEVAEFLQKNGHVPVPVLFQNPEFRAVALQPVGPAGETFLVEPHTGKILLHRRKEWEGREMAAIYPGPGKTVARARGGNPEASRTPEAGQEQVLLAPVSVPLPDGRRLLVGAPLGPSEAAAAPGPYEAYRSAWNRIRLWLSVRLRRFHQHLILVLAFFSLVGFALCLTLMRGLTQDVHQLSRAVAAYNAGDLDYRLSGLVTQELAQLAETLNRMAASLQENTISKDEWETTFDIIPDLIMVMDTDQRLVRLNQAAAAYLGISPEEACGRPCRELMAQLAETQRFFPNSPDNSRQVRDRQEFYWEDQGRIFLGSLNLLHSRAGKITGAVLVARDITAFRQMQRELAQTSHFLNQILEAAPLALAVVNRDGLFTHINPQIQLEYGYSPEELLDRHFSMIYTDETEMSQVMAELRRRGEVINFQVNLRHRDGYPVPARLSIRKLYGEQGEVLGSVALSSNISEEISLRRQLEAAQKQEAIATLAAGLAHNFNNLLMVVMGLTTLMLSKTSPEHPFYADLKEIERQVRHGREITRKLLSFRRGLGEETRPLDLNNLVEFTVDMFARARREVRVHKDLAPHLPAVEVDPSQMQQVLMNLLINAWQAMPQGGEITVRTRLLEVEGWKDCHFEIRSGSYLCLSVIDTGEGMDAETLAHLFEPFFTTKKPGEGSGLGLASACRIVKNHRGAIRVWSEKGQGARFDIYLPASPAPAQTLVPLEGQQIITGQGTVLVVDDEPLLRRVAVKLLQKLGYQALEAASGEDALEIFQERGAEIDLVLLDLIMPGLNGLQTLERLRALNPQVPVLLCSGYSERQEHELPPGVNFLAKPYPLEVLSQRLSEALAKGRA